MRVMALRAPETVMKLGERVGSSESRYPDAVLKVTFEWMGISLSMRVSSSMSMNRS